MNKIVIPALLVSTVMVAGMFAFMPVEQANTVHTTITDAINIEDIFADIDTAASTNNDAIIVDFIISEQSGDAVVGLIATDFATDFIAGANPGAVTITVTNSGSGGYRITIDPTNNWDAGRTSIVLTATSGGISASVLLVVDIT